MKLCYGSVMVVLRQLRQPGENRCIFSSLWLLVSASSLLAHKLPTLGSGNSAGSVISKTNGTVNRMKSNTHPTPTSLLRFIDHSLVMEKGLISMKL